MNGVVNVPLAPTAEAPVKGIKMAYPDVMPHPYRCEMDMSVGFFFDGTQNNRIYDQGKFAHTNIARLASAYHDARDLGYFAEYVPGVGTPFPEIGEHEKSSFGLAFGAGCEGRVLFALLKLLNVIHWSSFNRQELFTAQQVVALCRNSNNAAGEDLLALRPLFMSSGLLAPSGSQPGMRQSFLSRHVGLLKEKLERARPKVVCCYLDVFGFSRGAAEARVFCNWLGRLVVDGKLAGIPLRIRFLGLFDTVASAGAVESVAGLVTNGTRGHGEWAAIESLRVPPLVENCVHMVAMHELRRNFPLDEIGVNGIMPAGCCQYAYPGSHSDVGGGYAPGDLGVSSGTGSRQGDALKLSQIPLNHMFECASAAGVPLTRDFGKRARGQQQVDDYDPFAIDPKLADAYKAFLEVATLAARPLHAWAQQYLNWRWQMRLDFHRLHQVAQARAADRKVLCEFNQRLIDDAELMKRTGHTVARRAVAALLDWTWSNARRDEAKVGLLDAEARQVLALAQSAPPTPEPLRQFFDKFVHDSLAGFNKPALECTGYWRYRKGFLGNTDPLIVSNDSEQTVHEMA